MRYILSLVLLSSIPTNAQTEKYFPTQLITSMIKDDTNRNLWRKVTVEINQPLSEGRLRTMAKSIKEENDRHFDRTWINFQFPNPISVGGAWAVVAFEGDKLESYTMNGPTRQQMLDAFKFRDLSDKGINQVWISFEPPGIRIALYEESGKLYFEKRYLFDLENPPALSPESISAVSLPLSSWGKITGEYDRILYDDVEPYWNVDSNNLMRRFNKHGLQAVYFRNL